MQTQLLGKFLRFVLAGLLATLLQYAVLVLAVEVFRLSPPIGSGIGGLLSAAANYYLNHRFTFQSTRPHRSAAYRFALISATGLAINVGLMQWLAVRQSIPYLLAQVVVSAIVLVWNFTGSTLWSFATPEAEVRRPDPQGLSG